MKLKFNIKFGYEIVEMIQNTRDIFYISLQEFHLHAMGGNELKCFLFHFLNIALNSTHTILVLFHVFPVVL